MPRTPFVAGNWKMNKGPAAADTLARELRSALIDVGRVDIAVAPPTVSLSAVARRLQHTGLHVAAQSIHSSAAGAHTGCVSAEMVRELGCAYAIVGHSERRRDQHETNEQVGQQVAACFRAGLLPIVCVGEQLTERDAGNATAVVDAQLDAAIAALPADQAASVTIAYEPVWAIGTGRAATPQMAQAMHAHIRAWLTQRFPAHVASAVRIQYGGSVKPGNAAELLSQPDIDGALVGGASLRAPDFVAIIHAALGASR